MDKLELIKTSDFWQENRPFFEAGLLRIVHSTPNFLVCNMCNSSYVTFDLVKLPAGEVRYGLRTTINQFKAMVDDEEYYIRWLDHLYQNDTWRKRLVSLNQETFVWMQDLKAQTDAQGPSDYVNPGYEDQLFRRNIAAQKKNNR